MEQMIIETMHASAERASYETLLRQSAIFKNNDTLVEVSNSVSQMLAILNQERQLIYANKKFCNHFDFKIKNEALGKRFGEIINCVNATKAPGGCGTSEFCRTCGAVNAILDSQNGKAQERECIISIENNDAMNLNVVASPYKVDNEEFTIFTITDISHEKRRNILERVFFHDVLNSAGGIYGLSELLHDMKDMDMVAELSQMIYRSSNNLINEIISQRQLLEAERGDLQLNISAMRAGDILKQLAELYSKHEITIGKFISIHPESENFELKTDVVLLRRILGNMLKNALEASLPDHYATLSAIEMKDSFLFSVHNTIYMERDIQLQLFKRSFTTKGSGRGIGTYSMKLFGENYLKGKVWFDSDPELGTTFYLELPKSI